MAFPTNIARVCDGSNFHYRSIGVPVDAPIPSVSPSDHAIIRSTIRQIYRDWSHEAAAERGACIDPLLDAVRTLLPSIPSSTQGSLQVLVPGAGLCRLAIELAKMESISVMATEISLPHLLATHYILSSGDETDTVFPWATQFSNHARASDQFRGYSVPEKKALDDQMGSSRLVWDTDKRPVVTYGTNLVINTDDFRDYKTSKHARSFDVVVTCFFLDTAPNVVEYMRVIKNVLAKGGSWVNVGPLLWNCFENGPGGRLEGDAADDEAAKSRQSEKSVLPETKPFDHKFELAWDEVIELLQVDNGFEVIKNVPKLASAGYILDSESMLLPMYQMGFFHAINKC
jgi:carnosine N-methyltransferase